MEIARIAGPLLGRAEVLGRDERGRGRPSGLKVPPMAPALPSDPGLAQASRLKQSRSRPARSQVWRDTEGEIS